MLSQARYMGNFAEFLVRRRANVRTDLEALSELERRGAELASGGLATGGLALPPGLELQWLGVSGYRLTYERQTLFIDPYVSRVSLRDALTRRMALPDPALVKRYLDRPVGERVLAVLVGHTHFDHALDAPALALRHGCPAYGSESLAALLRLHRLPESQVVTVTPHRRYEIGPFTVTFIPSVHSKLVLGWRVPMDGELSCDHLDGMSAGAYRCGRVYAILIEVAGVRLYHQGSSNLLDDEVPGGGVDLFLAGVAGRGFTERYWQRILTRLQPRVVVPTHYDDFFRPLDAEPGLTLNVRLARVPEEVANVSDSITVAALPVNEVLSGAGPSR